MSHPYERHSLSYSPNVVTVCALRRMHPAIHVVATSGAFSGRSVPYGIAADAFYEKATALSFLLEVIDQAAQSDWALRRHPMARHQFRISPAGRLPANDIYVLIACRAA